MTLFRIKSAPLILIEDDCNKNIFPLLLELVEGDNHSITLFCYEQSSFLWRKILNKCKNGCNSFRDCSSTTINKCTSVKSVAIIDSINQMVLNLGWNETLKVLRRLIVEPNIIKLILILHTDCIPHNSKLQTHLNHLVNVVITYDKTNPCKIWTRIKKGSKIIRSEELISYGSKTDTLKLSQVVKKEVKEQEPERLSPANLSTFKIEVDQMDMIQKNNLQLPYMSKIHEGESKVYYEPDAVDDWDEEDPDEDLDI